MSTSVTQADKRLMTVDTAPRAEIPPSLSEYIVEHSPSLIIRLRADGSLVYVNEACCRVSGHSESEMLNEGMTILFDREQDIETWLLAANPQASGEVELPLRTTGGELRMIRWQIMRRTDARGELADIIGAEIMTRAQRRTDRDTVPVGGVDVVRTQKRSGKNQCDDKGHDSKSSHGRTVPAQRQPCIRPQADSFDRRAQSFTRGSSQR